MIVFERVENMIKDAMSVCSYFFKTAVGCIFPKRIQLQFFENVWVVVYPLMTSADRKVFCQFIRYETGDQPAELMTATFKIIKDWWEVEFFKNVFNGLDGSNRKSLILVWFYVMWCLQCGLYFITNKTQPLKALNIYLSAKLRIKKVNKKTPPFFFFYFNILPSISLAAV